MVEIDTADESTTAMDIYMEGAVSKEEVVQAGDTIQESNLEITMVKSIGQVVVQPTKSTAVTQPVPIIIDTLPQANTEQQV